MGKVVSTFRSYPTLDGVLPPLTIGSSSDQLLVDLPVIAACEIDLDLPQTRRNCSLVRFSSRSIPSRLRNDGIFQFMDNDHVLVPGTQNGPYILSVPVVDPCNVVDNVLGEST